MAKWADAKCICGKNTFCGCETPKVQRPANFRLYLDCDGVLADFSQAFFDLTGTTSEQFETIHGTKAFWKTIREAPNFFGTLPLMPGARQLYDAVKHLRPIILTGCPFGNWAEHQKFGWRDRQFPGVPMVTCLSRNKKSFCQPGDVLVDDLEKYRHLWEQSGGTFILHTSVESSIEQLHSLGVI
jgi:hypothetical protein